MPSEILIATRAVDRVVTATLNYLRPCAEKPKRHLFHRPGLLEWTGVNDPRAIPIADARGQEGYFTLDRNGFALLKKLSVERDFKDESAITGVYYDECAAIVRSATGAQRVLVFDHTLRGPDQPREPVMRVHNDYTEKSAPQRVRDLLPDEAEVRSRTATSSSMSGVRSAIPRSIRPWRCATRPSSPMTI